MRKFNLIAVTIMVALFLFGGITQAEEKTPEETTIVVEADGSTGNSWKADHKQGLHYYKKKMHGQAIAAFERAVADKTGAGAKDFKTLYYLAKAWYEGMGRDDVTINDCLEAAHKYGDLALKHATTPKEETDAGTFTKRLRAYYVPVRAVPVQGSKSNLSCNISNIKKKKTFEEIKDQITRGLVTEPKIFYFPLNAHCKVGSFEFKTEPQKKGAEPIEIFVPAGNGTPPKTSSQEVTLHASLLGGGGAAFGGLAGGVGLKTLDWLELRLELGGVFGNTPELGWPGKEFTLLARGDFHLYSEKEWTAFASLGGGGGYVVIDDTDDLKSEPSPWVATAMWGTGVRYMFKGRHGLTVESIMFIHKGDVTLGEVQMRLCYQLLLGGGAQ